MDTKRSGVQQNDVLEWSLFLQIRSRKLYSSQKVTAGEVRNSKTQDGGFDTQPPSFRLN